MLRIVALGYILDLQYRLILLDGCICIEQCKGKSSLNRNICKEVVHCFSFSMTIFFLSDIYVFFSLRSQPSYIYAILYYCHLGELFPSVFSMKCLIREITFLFVYLDFKIKVQK